ncbi:hypothetical protein [Streptomyces sp. NPDC017991]|uniref:hypothetical protein n=1 Tax=Streptomyces sp. NPDC017991 TaxID=3365026 RepID=UPI0037BDCEE9
MTGPAAATRAIRRSGLVLAVSCAVFALSAGVSPWTAVGVLAVGAVLQVGAEMQQSRGPGSSPSTSRRPTGWASTRASSVRM